MSNYRMKSVWNFDIEKLSILWGIIGALSLIQFIVGGIITIDNNDNCKKDNVCIQKNNFNWFIIFVILFISGLILSIFCLKYEKLEEKFINNTWKYNKSYKCNYCFFEIYNNYDTDIQTAISIDETF